MSVVSVWIARVSSVFVPQVLCLGREVVVGLRSLELRLAVLADHDERRQEDRLERDDQGQPRPRIGFDEQHPARERGGMDVHERHGAGEPRDRVRDTELDVGCSPSGVLRRRQDGGGVGVGTARPWVSCLPFRENCAVAPSFLLLCEMSVVLRRPCGRAAQDDAGRVRSRPVRAVTCGCGSGSSVRASRAGHAASHSSRLPNRKASHPIAQVMPRAPSPGLAISSTPSSTSRAPPRPMAQAPDNCLRAVMAYAIREPPTISDHVAMTTSSASAVIDGHRKVTTPATIPVTPQKATQPRWTSSRSVIAADRR